MEKRSIVALRAQSEIVPENDGPPTLTYRQMATPLQTALCAMLMVVLRFCAAPTSPEAHAATGLNVQPAWQAHSAKVFTVRNGAVFADGAPFPLTFHFNFEPDTEPLFHYASQFLSTVQKLDFALNVGGELDFSELDRHYEYAAKHHVYVCVMLEVAQDPRAYLEQHPEAAMRQADGSLTERRYVSYLDPGYRQALRESLRKLAEHVRSRSYHFGYYPQDEYAYGEWAGYEEPSLRVFRQRMVRKYDDLAGINRAWGTAFATVDAVMPPKAPEVSAAWVDFQEHRVWAQCDFAGFVTKTLHEFDPNHLVVWSLPFWGSPIWAGNLWSWPPLTDVLIRHGIDFSTGVNSMVITRDVAEASGKVASALCMPPDYDPGYVQMMFSLASGRGGLAHVCIGGSPEYLYYQGAADATNGWKRKEPIYTASRDLNALVRYLGPTYLLSKQRRAPIGVFQSDRTLILNGIQEPAINGVFLLLEDLNLDYRVFSENALDRMGEFPVVIVGPFCRCLTDTEAKALRAYVERGGSLIFIKGAAEADQLNRPAGSPGFGLAELVGKGVGKQDTASPDPLIADAVALRQVDKGRVLAISRDFGSIYQSAWTRDFGGFSHTDLAVIDANAFGDTFVRRKTAGEQPASLQGQRAWALSLRRFMYGLGVRPAVTIAGVTDTPGAVRAKSFRQGKDYWVGFANRVVRKGVDHKFAPPDRYHVPFDNLRCTVRVDADALPTAAYRLPMNRLNGELQRALPEVLPVVHRGSGSITFMLPRLEDMAAVLLTNDYPPLVGIAANHYHAVPGDVVHLTGRIINSTRKPFAGALRVDAENPLAPLGRPVRVALRPGESKDVPLVVRVPLDAEPGHALLQVVVERPGAAARTSPSIELEIQPPVEVAVVNGDRTLMPAGGTAGLEISGLARVPAAAVNLRATLSAPPGFTAAPNPVALKQGTSGRLTARTQLTDADPSSRVGTDKVRIEGSVRGRHFTQEFPLRFARGTVTYEETLLVKPSANDAGIPTRLIALENDRIKVNFVPNRGEMHKLVLRETNTDLMGGGQFPFGVVLYGWKGGWSEMGHSADGRHAELRLASTAADGKPVTMTASLNAGEDFVRIEYDFGAMGPITQTFYIMARISPDGGRDVMLIPRKAGEQQCRWGESGWVELAAGDLSAPYAAVRDSQTGEALVVGFHAPGFANLRLKPGHAAFDYILFDPTPGVPPGKAVLLLGGLKGSVEEARRLGERLASHDL